ncbi:MULTISPECIES: PepSY domain-containing protein [Psychrobacter]|uniref:PepSY domain-containing protein n=1 Tax=Psychrobacter TaxID=497 RepID=UPI001CB6DBEE|nr:MULTISPECIES: PepSY domain-containing protein [Psychrobacter]
MSLPLLKPLLLTVGATSLVFFGGVIALSVQSPNADSKLSAANALIQNTDIAALSSDLSSFGETTNSNVTNPLTPPAKTSPLAVISAKQATTIAQQDAPYSVLQAQPELVNYDGTVAYEVLLDSGTTYIDARVGTVLNPALGYDYRVDNFDKDDDDDYEDDDRHHDEAHHKKHKHKSHNEKLHKNNDRYELSAA